MGRGGRAGRNPWTAPAGRGSEQAPEAFRLADRLALTVPEAAERLGVSLRHLRAMLPKIPHMRLGGRVVIPVDDMRRWLSEQAREQQAERQAAIEAFLRDGSSS
jgi:excisionase family DNA binding protein